MKINLGIDFGSCNLTIYKKGEGILFKQPALICVKKQNDKYSIIALGKDAQDLQLNNSDNLVVFSPIFDGVVKSIEYGGSLLKFALNEVLRNTLLQKINCEIAVPCGLNQEEKNKYAEICKFAGIKAVKTIDCPILAKLGAENNLPNSAVVIVDIGASKSDIAVVLKDEIISGATLALGGKTLDNAILMMLEEENFVVTEQIAEQIKNELATLFPNDTRKMNVNGIDKISEEIYPKNITAKQIYPIIKGFFDEIAVVIKSAVGDSLEKLNEKYIDKIIITGGLCEIVGLEQFLSRKIGIKVSVSEKAENAVSLGFSKTLS